MKKSKLLLGIFITVSILYIIGVSINNLTMEFIFKPLIILSLIQYYLLSVKKKNNLLVAAFFLCFLGDIVLLYDKNSNAFMLGLIFFLIAHVLFIVLVIRILKKATKGQIIISILPFGLILYSIISLLKESLGELLIPVIVYASVISIFGAVSFLNYLINKTSSSIILLGGVLFFVLSDFALAINKFYLPHEYFSTLISVTYILAQFLICKFMILRDEEVESMIVTSE